MAVGGYKAKAGQAVRIVDLPAERRSGCFDALHGCETGASFANQLKNLAATHYGHAGREYLEKLTSDKTDLCKAYGGFKALPTFAADDGQDARVAARFALYALAGKLATEYGITGWGEGNATDAAAEGLKAWLSTRPRGNAEKHQILEQVSGFIQKHGNSRFADVNNPDTKVINQAGYWRDTEDGREYLFYPAGMNEALTGHELKKGLDVLQEAGKLPPTGGDGKRSEVVRIGRNNDRLYRILPDRLEAEN
jgi:putative DNA primase/helicase